MLTLALRELEQADFLKSVAEIQWDEADTETRDWQDADLTGPLDPWEPAS